MFFHALGNLNLYFPLRWSFAHSLNITSCPWHFLSLLRSISHSRTVLSCSRQLQFIFLASAVIHTFPECHLMPLAVSPASVVNYTFPECSFMPSATSIYISNSGRHSLNAASCPWQFQFTFSTSAAIRI